MGERQELPHDIPYWIDPAKEIWFLTMCCKVRGTRHLVEGGMAERLIESVKFRQKMGHWYSHISHIFLIMPDHCHGLFTFPPDRQLAKTVRDWKHWTAVNLGVVWQTDFFEHRLRGNEQFSAKFRYILENPVRAGFSDQADEWPYVLIAEWASPENPEK